MLALPDSRERRQLDDIAQLPGVMKYYSLQRLPVHPIVEATIYLPLFPKRFVAARVFGDSEKCLSTSLLFLSPSALRLRAERAAKKLFFSLQGEG